MKFKLLSGPIVLLSLRKQRPDLNRPYRMPLPMFFASFAFVISNFIVYWTGWKTNSKLFFIVLGGAIILLVYNRIRSGQKFELHFKSGLWVLLLIIGQLVLSWCGSFGGGSGLLPFGWDLLVVGAFSIILLNLAVASRLEPYAMETIEV